MGVELPRGRWSVRSRRPRSITPSALGKKDPETGLYYYRARYYDPKWGRFISEDPIRFAGGMNFYAYAENNPVTYTYPFGESVVLRVLKLASGQIGRAVSMLEAQIIRRKGGDIVAQGGRKSQARRVAGQVEDGAFRNDPTAAGRMHHGPHKPGYRPHFQTEGKRGHTFYSIAALLAPTTLEISSNVCATNGQVASAVAWDVVGAIDPIGLTDLIGYFSGLN